MAEQKVAEGICREISERGDWITFHIDVGSQYPVRLATKKSEIIEEGRAASRSGAVMAWYYNEVETEKINEKSGKPFINRYLEKVEASNGTSTTTSSTSQGVDEKMTKADWDNKDRRDYRSRSWAQTISALHQKEGETDDAYFLRLQSFQRKVYTDITGTFAYPEDGSDLPFE